MELPETLPEYLVIDFSPLRSRTTLKESSSPLRTASLMFDSRPRPVNVPDTRSPSCFSRSVYSESGSNGLCHFQAPVSWPGSVAGPGGGADLLKMSGSGIDLGSEDAAVALAGWFWRGKVDSDC